MSRRFIPPGIAAFGEGPASAAALAEQGARAEGFAEGRAQGLTEGRAAGLREGLIQAADAHQAAMDALCEKFAKHTAVLTVAEALARLLDDRAADRAALDAAAGTAVAAALQAIFPVLAARAGADIVALTAATLAERDDDRLVLRAAAATLDDAANEGLVASDRLTLLPDPAFAAGRAEIAWAGGGLTFDPAGLCARVCEILSPRMEEHRP